MSPIRLVVLVTLSCLFFHAAAPNCTLAQPAPANRQSEMAASGNGPASLMPVEEQPYPTDPSTWLQESIRASSIREIQAALNAGAQLTEESLWLAAIHTDAPTLDFLLKRMNISPLSTFTIGITPSERQDNSPVGLTLRRRILSLLTSGRQQTNLLQKVSLLHLAAIVGNTDTARYLLDQGVNPNAVMSNGTPAVLVAYASWLRTWNPMHVAVGAFTTISRKTNYPGFIYALLDKGANYAPLESLIEERRDSMERYVISLASDFQVPMKGGGFEPLGQLLEGICTNTAWGLVDMQLFSEKSPNYCRMVVIFIGRLKSDGSSLCVPFAFLDDRFVLPGDVSIGDSISIWHESKYYSREENVDFLDSLGIDLHDTTFWDTLDARFE